MLPDTQAAQVAPELLVKNGSHDDGNAERGIEDREQPETHPVMPAKKILLPETGPNGKPPAPNADDNPPHQRQSDAR